MIQGIIKKYNYIDNIIEGIKINCKNINNYIN